MDRSLQHAFAAEEIMAYLDGELEPQRAAALAAHLVSCGECQEVAKSFRAVSDRMLSFEVEHPSAGTDEKVLAALDSGTSANGARTGRAVNHGAWNWRHVFPRPRIWAIASVVAVVSILAIAIPNLRREGSLPLNGRSVADLMKLERGQNATSSGYKSWLSRDATAVTRSGTNLYQTSTEAGETDGAAPAPPPSSDRGLQAPEVVGPMIVQTASLSIVATNYDDASAAIERLAAAHGGYVEKLDAKAQSGTGRELSAALRIPAKQLDEFLADVRKLGHVEEESRENEDVSAQYVDLQARLRSARATEQRLIELLGTRTGKLEDVLDTERELARIRGEIESMQGQNAILLHRVSYATVQVALSEVYRERLGTDSKGTRIRNAVVEGFGNVEDGAVSVLIFLLAYGPALLFWLAILLVPSWLLWRRFRPRAQA